MKLIVRLMNYKLLIFFAFIMIQPSCKKDSATPKIPTVTTTAPSNVTANTATVGGTITSNGSDPITASGVCYSDVSNMPTISNDTTRTTATSGTFSSELKNLSSSATYYVRAYATNAVGTGYGQVIEVVTGNGAPVASEVMISGDPDVGSLLTATYAYSDPENDQEGATTFQWYRADNGAGLNESAITDATESTYRSVTEDEGKYIRVGVTPKATAGTSTGTETKSAFIGGIGDDTEVTFTYRGSTVTYGILTSPVTGRKWLDRNLGAANAPTAFDDWANYGDLFQWGRGDDGHQVVTRTGPIAWPYDSPPVWTGSATIGNPDTNPAWSSTDTPGHGSFIPDNYAGADGNVFDWRNPQNDSLWQGVDGINNPCPEGWRIPTQEEWIAEGLSLTTSTSASTAYTNLKLTLTGARGFYDSEFTQPYNGLYWSSTATPYPGFPSKKLSVAFAIHFSEEDAFSIDPTYWWERAYGYACRCIKE